MQKTGELVEAMAKAMFEVGKLREEYRWEKTNEQTRFFLLRDARAALKAIEESGTHVVVPMEMTDDMLNAAQERLCEVANPTYFNDFHQDEMFKAMLAARPKVTP
jgi:hypothetical protein